MRFEGDYDSFHSQLTLGAELSDRILFLTKGRFSDIGSGQLDRRNVSAQSRWEAEAAGVYRFYKDNFIEVSYTSVLSGRNTVLEKEWKVGFWTKF